MDFGGPGKLVPANPAHLPKWAGLAGTGLPGPLKAMKKKFFGVFFIVPHMKRYQTAHKVELVPAGGIYLYNWQNVDCRHKYQLSKESPHESNSPKKKFNKSI